MKFIIANIQYFNLKLGITKLTKNWEKLLRFAKKKIKKYGISLSAENPFILENVFKLKNKRIVHKYES